MLVDSHGAKPSVNSSNPRSLKWYGGGISHLADKALDLVADKNVDSRIRTRVNDSTSHLIDFAVTRT